MTPSDVLAGLRLAGTWQQISRARAVQRLLAAQEEGRSADSSELLHARLPDRADGWPAEADVQNAEPHGSSVEERALPGASVRAARSIPDDALQSKLRPLLTPTGLAVECGARALGGPRDAAVSAEVHPKVVLRRPRVGAEDLREAHSFCRCCLYVALAAVIFLKCWHRCKSTALALA